MLLLEDQETERQRTDTGGVDRSELLRWMAMGKEELWSLSERGGASF
jgi:hypothetical protein